MQCLSLMRMSALLVLVLAVQLVLSSPPSLLPTLFDYTAGHTTTDATA